MVANQQRACGVQRQAVRAGLAETQRVMTTQNRLIESVPEVASVLGKMGRAETALDPAPIALRVGVQADITAA